MAAKDIDSDLTDVELAKKELEEASKAVAGAEEELNTVDTSDPNIKESVEAAKEEVSDVGETAEQVQKQTDEVLDKQSQNAKIKAATEEVTETYQGKSFEQERSEWVAAMKLYNAYNKDNDTDGYKEALKFINENKGATAEDFLKANFDGKVPTIPIDEKNSISFEEYAAYQGAINNKEYTGEFDQEEHDKWVAAMKGYKKIYPDGDAYKAALSFINDKNSKLSSSERTPENFIKKTLVEYVNRYNNALIGDSDNSGNNDGAGPLNEALFDENGKLKKDVAGRLSGSYEPLESKFNKIISKNIETESPQSSIEGETKIINNGAGPLNEALFAEDGKLKKDVADSLSGSYESLEGKLDKAVSKNVKSESPQFIIEGETKTINHGAGPLNADLFNEAEKLMKDLDDSIPKGYETLDEKIKKQEERTKIFDLTMEIASLAANNNDESGNNKIADCIKEVLNRRKNNYQVDTTLELGSQGFVFNDTQRIVEGKIKVEALVDEIIRDFKTGDKDKQERYIRLKENQKENFEGFKYSYSETQKQLDIVKKDKTDVDNELKEINNELANRQNAYSRGQVVQNGTSTTDLFNRKRALEAKVSELDQQIISLTAQIDAYGETEIDFSNMFQVRSAIDKSSSKIEGQKEKLRKLQRDEAAMEGALSAFSKMVYNLENGKSYEDAENMIVGYRYFDSTETIIYDFSTTINPELDDRIVPVTYKELYGDSDFNKRLMGMLIKNEDGNLVYQNSKEFDTFFDEEFAKLSSQDSLSLASEIKALQDEMNKEAKKLLVYQSIESDVKESVQYMLLSKLY